jgi:hypothetical protein
MKILEVFMDLNNIGEISISFFITLCKIFSSAVQMEMYVILPYIAIFNLVISLMILNYLNILLTINFNKMLDHSLKTAFHPFFLTIN